MANVGSRGIVRYEETLATNTIGAAGTGVAWLISKDGGSDFVRAVAAGKGLHVYGTTDTGSGDRHEFASDTLMFTGQEGHCSVEIILQLGTITDVAFFFGFNDVATANGDIIPVKLDTTTFTQNTVDGLIGILYDTGAENDELHCFWGNGGTKTTETTANLRMIGMAPTASEWLYMKVEMQDRGSGKGVRATFLAVDHNGKSVEKVFNTSVNRILPLCYYLGMENRISTARTIYLRGIAWEQTIADM